MRNLIVGLDIGSQEIKIVAARQGSEESPPQILAAVSAPSAGIRRDVVVDINDLTAALREAAEKCEKVLGSSVKEAVVSIGGNHVEIRPSRGAVAVSRADGEISEDDIKRAIKSAQAISLPQNRTILHVIPRDFTVDSEHGVKDPLGMTGVRLEVDALIIDGFAPAVKNLTKALEEADIDVNNFILNTLAASTAVLDKRQRELGVLMLDIGAGATGMAVFEEGNLLHTRILPIGSGHITNDLAVGLRTEIDVAERVKLEYGAAMAELAAKKEIVNLSKIMEGAESEFSRRHIAEIIEARLCEIFDLVQKELKKIGRAGLLPAGVVLCGGGAQMPGIAELAKRELKLPAKIGYPQGVGGLIDKVDSPSYAGAVGLILWTENFSEAANPTFSFSQKGHLWQDIKKFFRSFLP
jgi:cell division protein FtsA